jgi:hypothetical protein
MIIFILTWPAQSLIAWTVCVFNLGTEINKLSGISIILIGSTVICLINGVLYIAWNNFKMSSISKILISLGILCLWTWKLCVVLI